MEFEKACSEINFILENLNPADKEKIPENVVKFFYDNRDIFYNVKLDKTKDLSQQELKEETKAFLQILHYEYFATKEEKEEFKKILEDTPDESLEQNSKKQIVDNDLKNEKQIAIYKENKIKVFWNKILKFFRIRKG